MILRLALRSLLAHPVRSVVLACGFGLGVGVMAMLLGVGDVILDQARSPALSGGGDVVLASAAGRIDAARWVMSAALGGGTLGPRVKAASPARNAPLYLIRDGRRSVPIRARGGIPSLERALGDPETAGVVAWRDETGDRAWASPDPGDVLRALDRFHPISDVPDRADSWAEWLYFNGRAGEHRFYLTFLVGPEREGGTRVAGVQLQLDRGGVRASYSATEKVVSTDVLRTAPDLSIAANSVHLNGATYELTLDLPAPGGDRIRGRLALEAVPGRAIPPLAIRGAGGWVSGYVVPVMSGTLSGTLALGRQTLDFDGGTGYHDHNWGFWEGVSWRWGQVQHGDLSVVYGRVYPPRDAADPDRIPGFLMVIGPNGPLGYASSLSIREVADPDSGLPRRIAITASGPEVDVAMDLDVQDAIVTRRGTAASFGGGLDFLQLRARYRVRGKVGNQTLDFAADGSAETFR